MTLILGFDPNGILRYRIPDTNIEVSREILLNRKLVWYVHRFTDGKLYDWLTLDRDWVRTVPCEDPKYTFSSFEEAYRAAMAAKNKAVVPDANDDATVAPV